MLQVPPHWAGEILEIELLSEVFTPALTDPTYLLVFCDGAISRLNS